MSELRPLAMSALDQEWLRRSGALWRCLFVDLLLFCGLAAVCLGLPPGLAEPLRPLEIGVLAGGLVWLLAAGALVYRGRVVSAGVLIVGLALAALALLAYLLPPYAPALLPLAALPTALAALLLGRRGIYASALLTALGLWLALAGAARFPPPPLRTALPPPGGPALALAGLALALLALTLDPLREMAGALLALVRQREAQIARFSAQLRSAERTRAAEQAQRSIQEQQRDTLVQHLSDGIVVVDALGVIAGANPTARALWAVLSDDDLVGQPVERLRGLLEGGGAAARYMELTPLPSIDITGAAYHLLRDRREQARYARLRGELMDLLTDEMRNPLTSVLTALDLVLGQQDLPEDLDRVLIGARHSATRLLDLVTTLLEINQLEQNPGLLRRTPTSLTRVLEASIAQMAPLAQQGAVTVTVEYGGDSTLALDSERMQRACAYLLEHALRRSPPYSTTQIRTARRNGAVEVRVSDQGPSVPPEQRAPLAQQRAASVERSSPALSLAFSRLVIEAHGGRMWLEGSEGQGNTFVVALPSPGSEEEPHPL